MVKKDKTVVASKKKAKKIVTPSESDSESFIGDQDNVDFNDDEPDFGPEDDDYGDEEDGSVEDLAGRI